MPTTCPVRQSCAHAPGRRCCSRSARRPTLRRAGFETAEVTTTRVRFAEKDDLPGATYVLAKLAAEILALPARVSGRGHDMLAYLRKPVTVTA